MIKSTAMLYYWWWRYLVADDSLWEHIVSSCNNLNMDKPLVEQKNGMTRGPQSFICSIGKLDKSTNAKQPMDNGGKRKEHQILGGYMNWR